MLTSSLDTNVAALADITDPYPARSRRITTSLALRPEDHLHVARVALELGLDRASLMRRALVASGLLSDVEGSSFTREAAALATVLDPYAERSRRVTTSLTLRPEDHLRVAHVALDLGLDRSSLMRRALVASGLIPGVDASSLAMEAAGA